MQTAEERLDALENRNKRVEADKQWEGSLERRASIMLMTYVIIGIFLTLIGTAHAWINAVVPSIGFLLSTLTLGFLKRAWVDRRLGEVEIKKDPAEVE
ncbi:MAG: hypothetical protein WCO52_01275 [bacterium]